LISCDMWPQKYTWAVGLSSAL